MKGTFRQAAGFTIVELLIVIVVIAILAAISIVAYTGIQQRAKNTAIIDAASKSLHLLEAYIAANGTYPVSGATVNICITTESGCNSGAIIANTTFDTNMATLGTLPRSVPNANATEHGVYLRYDTGMSYQGISRPMLLQYFLTGTAQNCGLPVVLYQWPDFNPSTTGYSSSDSANNRTRCWVSVPGPSV